RLMPGDTDERLANLARGILLSQDGQYGKALDSLYSSLQNDDRFAPAHLELARIYLKQENVEKTREQARQIAENRDWVSSARAMEARAALIDAPARKKMEEALELARQAIKEDGNNPEAMVAKSLCDLLAGQVGSARNLIDKALAIEPGNIEAIIVRARLLKAEGKDKDSLSLLLKTRAFAAGESDLLTTIARAYQSQGDSKIAMDVLKNGTENGRSGARVAFELAKLLRDQGKNKQAKKYFDTCLANGLSGPKAVIARQALKELKQNNN
ncbi:MAG: hypothetical protein K8F91_24180, partial [Candidatus Obscuribacterales bacterium]|nr:hypothetical protein [Candidatus Obscuribacterales bacterium]